MLTELEIRSAIDIALAASNADQTEVIVFDEESSLTRFANNVIHQNVSERNASVQIRAVLGKCSGVTTVNDLGPESLRSAARAAIEIARHTPENQEFLSLPGPRPVGGAPEGWVPATERFGPLERAAAAGTICRRAEENGLNAAGFVQLSLRQTAVANSLGTCAIQRATVAQAAAVVASDDGSGYADRTSIDLADIDVEALAAEAVNRAKKARNPIDLPVGDYPVVLEPYAVADVIEFLTIHGFSARAYQEQHSFLTDKLGEQILGANIRIWDDPRGPGTIPQPFDFEGVPTSRVDFIENGVAKAVCYDSFTAGRARTHSTGHALPAGSWYSPLPTHLFLGAGDQSIEELIAGVERGLLVTRFWYTRTVHPMQVVVTGMTRDGTFLIERGEIVAPVRNLRFTQGYLKAMNEVEALGRETKLQYEYLATRVPAVRVSNWSFTGKTER